MKKSLVALAALAVAGVASAQSSVTLFGIVDASISHYSTKADYYNNTPLYLVAPNGQLVVNPAALAFAPNQLYGQKQSQTALANSGLSSSRIGFRGTEDLGGGLAASFWLEAPLSNDNGAGGIGSFARRSTVSLSGGFGEVRLGRDFTPTFWNDTAFDPFGTDGVGTNLINTINTNLHTARGGFSSVAASDNYVRTSNSIGYFLPPNLGGFYGQVQYALHENVKSSAGLTTAAAQNCLGAAAGSFVDCAASARGRYIGGRFGYANGPLDVAVAYGQSTVADVDGTASFGLATTGVTADRKLKTLNVGASYDFGPVKLFGELSQVKDKLDASSSSSFGNIPVAVTSLSQTDKYNGALVGVTVPVGAGLIRAGYSRVKFSSGAPVAFSLNTLLNGTNSDASANKFALGYVHNLSKRTALYATVARVRIKDGQNNGVMGATTGGAPGYPLANANSALVGYAPRSATGYDFGIRHSF